MPRKNVIKTAPANAVATKDAKLYQMVVQALRAEILRGVYPVGHALPSESVLVERFGVSRHTIREALRNLRDLGMVESRQGKGTIVIKPGGPQVYVHQVNSIADLHDFNVESRYDDQALLVTLDEPLAARLGTAAGEKWLRINGLRYDGQGTAICAVEIYVPERLGGISRLLGRRSGPVYALIEDIYGESFGEVQQELRALPLPTDIAMKLESQPGETGVEIRRIYRLLDGEAGEITFNYYKAENFSFSMSLKRVRNGN